MYGMKKAIITGKCSFAFVHQELRFHHKISCDETRAIHLKTATGCATQQTPYSQIPLTFLSDISGLRMNTILL